MQVKVEIGGVRLDKAVADLTPLSRSHANEQIKNGHDHFSFHFLPLFAKYSSITATKAAPTGESSTSSRLT